MMPYLSCKLCRLVCDVEPFMRKTWAAASPPAHHKPIHCPHAASTFTSEVGRRHTEEMGMWKVDCHVWLHITKCARGIASCASSGSEHVASWTMSGHNHFSTNMQLYHVSTKGTSRCLISRCDPRWHLDTFRIKRTEHVPGMLTTSMLSSKYRRMARASHIVLIRNTFVILAWFAVLK